MRTPLTTERVVAAAAELADEIGFENLTGSALARRLGVKDASLYVHVRNAHDLKVQVALLALAELADRAADALVGRAGEDALVAFANAYRDYAREHPGRYAAAQLRLDPETAIASAAPRHSGMTRALLRGYPVPEADHVHAVRMLHSTLYGFSTLEATGAFAHSGPTTPSWLKTLEALHTTLTSWPGTGSGDGVDGGSGSEGRGDEAGGFPHGGA